jgi:hypothetical protein
MATKFTISRIIKNFFNLKEIPEGRAWGMGLTRPPEKRENINEKNDSNDCEKIFRTI